MSVAGVSLYETQPRSHVVLGTLQFISLLNNKAALADSTPFT